MLRSCPVGRKEKVTMPISISSYSTQHDEVKESIPPHLLPDDSDKLKELALHKKHFEPRDASSYPSAEASEAQSDELRSDVIIPAMVRVTTASREGCAPNPPRYEVNDSTHTLSIEQYGCIRDMTNAWWHSDEDIAAWLSASRCESSALLLQSPTSTRQVTALVATSSPHRRRRRQLPNHVISKAEVLSTLPQLMALTTVVIRHNYALERLPIEALHYCRYLKKLDVSYNHLCSIPAKLFVRNRTVDGVPCPGRVTSAFPDLLELHLNNNQISWVPKEVFTAMPRLQVLSLGNNLFAGMPSTLGNHCLPDAALKTISLHNNVLIGELDNDEEVQLLAGGYKMYVSLVEEYYETIAAGGCLSREREREIALERQRMPLKVSTTTEERGPVYVEGNRVLLQLIREELAMRAAESELRFATANDERKQDAGYDFYHGPSGWRLDRIKCNMCQCELVPLFSAYQEARDAFFQKKEAAALGPSRCRPKTADHDFSFFLDGDKPKTRPPVTLVDAGTVLHHTAWQVDETLMWMVGEALSDGYYAGTEPILCCEGRQENSGFSLTSYCPPYCCVKYVDLAGLKDVPLMYLICGSSTCRKALNELSTDGNAVQNFSRIDYSKAMLSETSDVE